MFFLPTCPKVDRFWLQANKNVNCNQCHFKTIYNIYLSSLDKSTPILGVDVILAFITSPKFLSIILIFNKNVNCIKLWLSVQ
jgi:hypothetical protein